MDCKSSMIGGLMSVHQTNHHHNHHVSNHHHHHAHGHHYHRNSNRMNPLLSSNLTSPSSLIDVHNSHHNHQSQQQQQQSTLSSSTVNCAACQKPIRERFLLKALDQLWHEDCLKCSCCDCRLGEVGSTLFTKANLILCKRDYLRLFGATGLCSACNKIIPAFEMVMRVRGDRVYHLECFQCSQCNHRFCIGDRFHLYDNRILCEYDYEEIMVFGTGTATTTTTTNGTDNCNTNANNNNNNGNNNDTNNVDDDLDDNNDHLDSNNNNNTNNKTINPLDNKLINKIKTESSTASIQQQPIVSVSVSSAVAQPQQQPLIGLAHNAQNNPQQQHHSPADEGSSGYGSPDSLLSDGR